MSFLDTMSAEQIFRRLGAQGFSSRQGDYFAICPCHKDTDPSLHIWDKRGRSYIHCHAGCTFDQLLNYMKGRFAQDPEPVQPTSYSGRRPRKEVREVTPPEHIYQPVPEDAPPAPTRFYIVEEHRSGKQDIQQRYAYHDTRGRLLGYIARFPGFNEKKGKTFRPLLYVRWNNGRSEWTTQWGFPEPRPLYNLHKIAARAEAPILLCEGEKSADAAELLFPNCVATTTMNGSSATKTADFSIAKGRVWILSPDNDQPGTRYAAHVATLLRQADARSVHLLRWPLEALPSGKDRFTTRRGPPKKGYDLADALAEGWTAEHVQLIKERGWPFLAQIIYPDEDLPELRTLCAA